MYYLQCECYAGSTTVQKTQVSPFIHTSMAAAIIQPCTGCVTRAKEDKSLDKNADRQSHETHFTFLPLHLFSKHHKAGIKLLTITG